MKQVFTACSFLFFLLVSVSFHPPSISDYDISAFYSGYEPANGTKVLTSSDDLEDAEIILTPTEINKGNYIVNITRKGSNLYKIDGKNIYIETKYCYKYSYGEEVVLKVESSYGYTKGKIIF